MATNGADVLGFVNTGTSASPVWVEVLSQTGIDLSENRALIDFSNKTSGDSTRNAPGRYSASIALNGFFVEGDATLEILYDSVRNGVLFELLIRIAANDWQRASGFLSQLSSGFPDQAPATLSGTMTVDGKIIPA
ncbi:MAG TPA: phage tail tube protein [Thermoleophilia bacterium]|nr:phage tail tube protein [Thermoleophilia bacterium]